MCIGIQLIPRPGNVEFTSLITFIVSAVLGISFGVGLGALVIFVNGFLSPWGFAGLILPFQIVGIALVGIGGGLYRRSRSSSYDATSCLETAILGAFLTLIYDVITNFGFAVTALAGQPILLAFITALVTGALFSLLHIVANTVLFAAAFVPVANAMQRLLGGEQVWKEFSHTQS